jgi:hypothetical protein
VSASFYESGQADEILKARKRSKSKEGGQTARDGLAQTQGLHEAISGSKNIFNATQKPSKSMDL